MTTEGGNGQAPDSPTQASTPVGSEARAEDAPRADLLLEVTDLVTHFETDRGTVRSVDGVSLSLEAGRTLGIVGESGSGKTVLSRSIMGLLPKRGTVRRGSVRFEGTEIAQLSPKQMREYWGAQMAMIFQDPMTSLNPVMKIGKQITESIRQHLDVSRDFADDLAENLLASVRIPEPRQRLGEYPHQLSGGMRQRVCIAVALACGPKLLFADEPTTALDVTVQAQVLDLIRQQQDERFMAMVLITHDLGVVAGRADEIAVMYAGRIVEHASTAVLFENMKMPYTEALLSSIPKLGEASHTRLATIPGRPPDLVHPPVGCKFAPRCGYVQDRCREEEPPLLDAAPGHQFRCWFPVGTPEGRAAFEANRSAGLAAAEAVAAATTSVGAADGTGDGA
jgi:peptide/nickel transport system ATP-binding protein